MGYRKEYFEMFPDGRDDLDNVHWGFKTRDQEEKNNQRIKLSG